MTGVDFVRKSNLTHLLLVLVVAGFAAGFWWLVVITESQGWAIVFGFIGLLFSFGTIGTIINWSEEHDRFYGAAKFAGTNDIWSAFLSQYKRVVATRGEFRDEATLDTIVWNVVRSRQQNGINEVCDYLVNVMQHKLEESGFEFIIHDELKYRQIKEFFAIWEKENETL